MRNRRARRREAMRILGIVCSPRKEGNTEIMMREALAQAAEMGAETELVLLAGKRILPCDACDACLETGACKVKDDMHPIYEQLDRADGILLGTPVYMLNVSAQAKIFMDRTYACLWTLRLARKVAAPIITARRVGVGQVLSLMTSYFSIHGMVVAGFAAGYGRGIGEVKEGPGMTPIFTALEEARAAARSVVRLAGQMERGKG
jgi:multimeric flavodoxin WrbA